jgi:uncharacterized membrane protein HdeD (DUF308 family)
MQTQRIFLGADMGTIAPQAEPTDARDQQAIKDSLAALGKHWGLLLTFGLVSVVIGLIALIWPSGTVVVFAIFFGAWLLVSGIFQLVESFSSTHAGASRVMLAISGVCGIILGLLCFRGADQSVQILGLLLGLGMLLRGILTLVAGVESNAGGRGIVIFAGAILAVGGIVVLVWPSITLIALAVLIGCWFLVFGAIEVIGALRIRKFV